METLTLTTTLGELNRLYGVYYELVNTKISSSPEVKDAWSAYEAYVKRFNEERGLQITFEPRRRI